MMHDPAVRSNPLRSAADWQAQRAAVTADPAGFHGAIAREVLHWYVAGLQAWLHWDEARQQWSGWHALSGEPLIAALPADYQPWQTTFDDSAAPLYRWFSGGLTNAAFNEVDRHVLAGYGAEPAFFFEGDRWDSSLDNGRGRPVSEQTITRRELLIETARAALVLRNLGLQRGDRIALNMPNIPAQLYYIEAAKRLGIVYTAVFGGFSDKTLSDRIHNAGARVVITSDGAYRNAQVIPYKESYTDSALDRYIPLEQAIVRLQTVLSDAAVPAAAAAQLAAQVQQDLAEEVTLERADVMRALGRALQHADELPSALQAALRTSAAAALSRPLQRVEAVVVVRHTGQDIVWHAERDRWSDQLLQAADRQIQQTAVDTGMLSDGQDYRSLDDLSLFRLFQLCSPCEPLDAEFPLFIMYTSGSTGKPKGVVHVHGGYTAGVTATLRVSFDAVAGDRIYVIADPGWITGQSYLISATLCGRLSGVLAEGSPVFPSAGRFASTIERHRISIFKAGVTFLKSVMANPQHAEDVRRYDLSSLRVATFCAEPVSPAVQQFGMALMTPHYINSYWATEHGGIVWTHFYGNPDFPLRPDAHTYPLPWVLGDVWRREEHDGAAQYCSAELEERGEIVICAPYPYLARTLWGDSAGFDAAVAAGAAPGSWRGDAERFAATYWRRAADGRIGYLQGDFAIKYADGSFSLHGRSDDVINVSGHRMGTEEIEGAILRDRLLNADSPVGNCIVVGAPHSEKGLTPLAFILPAPGRRLTQADRRRLDELVRSEKGAVSVPEDYLEVSAFPETRSGKYLRRFLRNLILNEPLGDTSTLRNPEILDELRRVIAGWQQQQSLARLSSRERTRYFSVDYFPPQATSGRTALVTVINPPVNALNERALDELNTLLDHLGRREDVAAVIFTGAGARSFVAGADIRQLLEEVHTQEDALTLPHNAQLAFAKIEQLGKPCIAAINGVALGGGLEFALACHYRICSDSAEFGLPEINLQLLPGYGGTQRLPRLLYEQRAVAGLADALEMILGGRSVSADEALQRGLVDEISGAAGPVSRAAELIRAALDEQGCLRPGATLTEQYRRRVERLSLRDDSDHSALAHCRALRQEPRLARLQQQAALNGRTTAFAAARHAIEYGLSAGITAGLAAEAEAFAAAVIDPTRGKQGIRAFLLRQSAPLATRRPLVDQDAERRLLAAGELLPVGTPFYPGITPLPRMQYAYAVIRDQEHGGALHGDPISAEQQIIIPVEAPGANDVLVYVLASEINYNDIWAITGIPVSLFDEHDRDWHVTGSGGIGLIVALGSEARRSGRLQVGDLTAIYSGRNDLLSPLVGLDPMAADFVIQGYNTPDGSHQQFVLVQAPQCLPVAADLSLEAAGSYILNLGTIYRALWTTLQIRAGGSIFIEGAATGTGLDAVRSALQSGLQTFGMVSSSERAAFLQQLGISGVINRSDSDISGGFRRIPADPAEWKAWQQEGEPLLARLKAANHGRLMDYVVSHAGETAFPRSFQLLGAAHDGIIPTLTFYGAGSGYHFTFLGKAGHAPIDEMLQRVAARAGQGVLVYYGIADTGLVDSAGLEAIEALRRRNTRLVIVCRRDVQREFVLSLGFGAALRAVISIEELERRYGDEFSWPATMPDLPDARRESAALKEAVRRYSEVTFKPLAAAVGAALRTHENPRGYPDLIIERAEHDALAFSAMLVKPFTGRIVYFEDCADRRYSFFAPQIWMRQRRIYMPTAQIFGTHLSNAYEITRLNEELQSGTLTVSEPLLAAWHELPAVHQAMWENRHRAANAVVNHALPRSGLRSKDELLQVWMAAADAGTTA
jgi:acrylyl-CoA reductase (NADPH) / 3-hydroxypropionyl-CoA dehydratase / 3-hydroxypropionyl-CoA synthetase